MAAPDSFLDAIASPLSEWVSDSFRFRMMRIHFGSVFERCTRVQHWLPKHSRRGVCKKWNDYLCALKFTELKKIGAFLDEGVWSKLTSWVNWKHKVFSDVFLGCAVCRYDSEIQYVWATFGNSLNFHCANISRFCCCGISFAFSKYPQYAAAFNTIPLTNLIPWCRFYTNLGRLKKKHVLWSNY